MHEFADDLASSKNPGTIAKVQDFLRSVMGFTEFKDISDSQVGISQDIDFLASRGLGTWWKVELKIRDPKYKKYLDVAIETESSVERKTPGWIHTCKADFLCYVFVDRRGSCEGMVFRIGKLRKWWNEIGSKKQYPEKFGKTKLGGGKNYYTRNCIVPLNDIPDDCIAA